MFAALLALGTKGDYEKESEIRWLILMGRSDLFWVMAQEATKAGSCGVGACFTDWCGRPSETLDIHLFMHLFIPFFFPCWILLSEVTEVFLSWLTCM